MEARSSGRTIRPRGLEVFKTLRASISVCPAAPQFRGNQRHDLGDYNLTLRRRHHSTVSALVADRFRGNCKQAVEDSHHFSQSGAPPEAPFSFVKGHDSLGFKTKKRGSPKTAPFQSPTGRMDQKSIPSPPRAKRLRPCSSFEAILAMPFQIGWMRHFRGIVRKDQTSVRHEQSRRDIGGHTVARNQQAEVVVN